MCCACKTAHTQWVRHVNDTVAVQTVHRQSYDMYGNVRCVSVADMHVVLSIDFMAYF
eukprot:m.367669 g.367669  ORF g.367669 m.367669 type:complete len:57 (+) comp41951_c0_seq1:315-485(+)